MTPKSQGIPVLFGEDVTETQLPRALLDEEAVVQTSVVASPVAPAPALSTPVKVFGSAKE
jgi:hypothetical protein